MLCSDYEQSSPKDAIAFVPDERSALAIHVPALPQRSAHPGTWDVPGGFHGRGDAVVRLFAHEAGPRTCRARPAAYARPCTLLSGTPPVQLTCLTHSVKIRVSKGDGMAADATDGSERALVRVGPLLNMAELERLRAVMRRHAVTLDFALVRRFDNEVLVALARAISTNSTGVVLRGLSVRHYKTLRRTGSGS